MTRKAALAVGTAVGAMVLAGSPVAAQTIATATPTPTTSTSTKPLKPMYRNVRSFYRNVRSFWGDVNPFYRNVRSFWGTDVDPYYRNVRSFWGTMDPAAMASAAGAPVYAGIGPFWDSVGGSWSGFAPQWIDAGAYDYSTVGTYLTAQAQVRALVGTSKGFWGAAVTKKTGKTFEAGFSDAFLTRYNLNLNDPTSFARLSQENRAAFFLDWYDGLMAFSGTDHADWWMKAINWTPQLSQRAAGVSSTGAALPGGTSSVLGLVDMYSAKSTDITAGRVMNLTPLAGNLTGHGEGVMGLVVAPHDGKGAMGVAPGARVIAYNPFDSQGGADWAGVAAGIQAVASRGATVVNLSLGASGYTLHPEWRNVFKQSVVETHKDKTLYIIAAGNEGLTQSGRVDMKDALATTFILVGSVGPGGISDFSNRPGSTCLVEGTSACEGSSQLEKSGYLRNRFIVAPGELILVSDGAGGLSRQSGTSVAAPLVAGAVALVQDRWPHLRGKPRTLAKIILGSARDLGAPGIDDVYGVGMLDVQAALSPLNYSTLKYYLTSSTGSTQNETYVSSIRSATTRASWAAKNMYLHAWEELGEANRDFLIPLSSQLHGQTRGGEYFQDYIYNRMIGALGTTTFTGSRGASGFTDGARTKLVDRGDGWTLSMTGRLVNGYAIGAQTRRMQLRSSAEITAPDSRFAFAFGSGDGAAAIGGGTGLSLQSDFDPYTGGANPLLGFASGGMHAGVRMALAPAVEIKAGFSRNSGSRGTDLYGVTDLADRAAIAKLGRYRADVGTMRVDYRPANWLTLSASASRLAEDDALLGVRSLAYSGLTGNTVTTGMTVGADVQLGGGFSLVGAATRSRSATDDTAGLRADGLSSTAYQAGIAKTGLLGKSDRLRLTVAQPIRVTGGSLELTQLQMIDRETGETALITERFDMAGVQPSRLVAEGLYGAPLMNGRAELGLWGRAELRDQDAGTPRVMIGSQFRLGF